MKLSEIIDKCNLKIEAVSDNRLISEKSVTGVYTGDLLSDVIANAKKDNLWITIQTHLNIIAVATLKELAAIIIVMNKPISDEVKNKAIEENVILLSTGAKSYEISGKLYELGIGR
ncbi:MAG: serine kinase [Ignavibacteria bacterium]|nr:serine kinase [Ignavibacteria bacterium]